MSKVAKPKSILVSFSVMLAKYFFCVICYLLDSSLKGIFLIFSHQALTCINSFHHICNCVKNLLCFDFFVYSCSHDSICYCFFVPRSEEHTSELQSLMRISYAVFCLTKNTP